MTNELTVTAPEGLPFIEMSREFDAPVSAVFAAHADPEVYAEWIGPEGNSVDIGEWDFTSGGKWSFINRDPDGNEFEFRGTFHTVRTDDIAIQTFEFGGYPDAVSLEFLHFVDLGDGRTRLDARSICTSVEARDGMVQSGMEEGMVAGYDKLDKILAG